MTTQPMSESERWSTRFGLFAGLTLGLWWAATWVVLWGVWYVVVLGALLVLAASYCAHRAIHARDAALPGEKVDAIACCISEMRPRDGDLAARASFQLRALIQPDAP